MAGKENALITIDLAQFKLHLNIEDKISLSLHFDSESRRFYLSVIALVLHEMKKSGEMTSIPLEKNYDKLALLNETVGGKAGSSDKKKLLARIYRKWKDDLTDLEHSPLFNVLGKKKEYEDAVGKTYGFTDEEKDAWANLFDYKGSHEYVRLRFSIDKLGATLDDVLITFEDSANPSDEGGWDGFIKSLRKSTNEGLDQTTFQVAAKPQAVSNDKSGEPWYRRRAVSVQIIALAVVVGIVAIWNFHLRPSQTQFEVASEKKMAFPLPEKPSIAVLAFANISGEPENEFLADGISEEIITTLSKVSDMFVIARNSTFIYKGKAINVKQVAEELGVRYVLEGTVHRSNNKVRINAQLIDALTGHHLWAERYNRDLEDIFSLLDNITREIVIQLQVELNHGEEERLWGRGTDNFETWENTRKAHGLLYMHSPENLAKAKRLIDKVRELDPEYVGGYVLLARYYHILARYKWGKSPDESLERSNELLQKAIAKDESIAFAHSLLGYNLMLMGKHDQAIIKVERAVALQPNSSFHIAMLATLLNYSGRVEEGRLLILKAMRLSPYYPAWYLTVLSQTYFMTGQYEEALKAEKKQLERNPKYLLSNARLAVIYSLMGREEEARAQAGEVLKLDPKFSLQTWAWTLFYKNKVDLDRELNALRKAGLE